MAVMSQVVIPLRSGSSGKYNDSQLYKFEQESIMAKKLAETTRNELN